MENNTKLWSVVSFLLNGGAYVPLAIGAIIHPAELNLPSYLLWLILTATMLYAQRKAKDPGWSMTLAFMLGNGVMVSLAPFSPGYTFDIGLREGIGIFGIAGTVLIYALCGGTNKARNPRILYRGMIAVDISAYYPFLKQYLGSHEPATWWFILGCALFLMGAITNLVKVENFFMKFRAATSRKEKLEVLETSLFSMEIVFFLILIIWLATR